MAKIILRAGKVANKIIILFAIFGFIFYSAKVLVPVKASVESVPDELSAELKQARKYVNQGQYDQATVIYNSIITDGQVDMRGQVLARGGLIIVDIHRGEIAAAEAALESLINNYPNEMALSSAVFDVAYAFSPTRPDKAITLFQKFLDTWPNCEDAIRAQLNLVRGNLALNNAAGAESAYQELLAKFSGHPDISDAVYTIAEKYFDLDKQKSLNLFQEVVEKWPNSQEAMLAQMGVVRANLLLNNEASAWAAYQELVAKFSGHPDMCDVVFTIADTYVDLNSQKSLELYQEVVEKWPDSQEATQAQVAVVRINIELKNEAAAQSAYQKLITQYSAHKMLPEAIIILAASYLNTEPVDPQRAIELFQYVLTNWPGSDQAIWAQSGIGVSCAALGNDAAVDTAVDKLLTDFANSPDVSEALCEIGEKYGVKGYEAKSQGLETEAKEYFQKAVSVWERLIQEFADYDFVARAYYCSAGCYELELSEYEIAIEYYQKILDNWPYFDYRRASYAQFGITRCYENLEKSGRISPEEAAVRIRQACNNLLADYPETTPAIIHAARKLLDKYQASE